MSTIWDHLSTIINNVSSGGMTILTMLVGPTRSLGYSVYILSLHRLIATLLKLDGAVP